MGAPLSKEARTSLLVAPWAVHPLPLGFSFSQAAHAEPQSCHARRPWLSEKLSRGAWWSDRCWKRRRSRWAKGRRGSGKGSRVLFPFPTPARSLAPPAPLVLREEGADIRILLCTAYHSGAEKKQESLENSHLAPHQGQAGWVGTVGLLPSAAAERQSSRA